MMTADAEGTSSRRRELTEVGIVAGLAMAAALVFRAAYINWGFVPVVAAAIVLSAGLSVLARAAGLRFGASTLISLVAYFPLGTITIFGLPSPDALELFFFETIRGWRGLLTTAVPVDPAGGLRIVPFIVAWLGSFFGAEAALRSRNLLLPALGPLFIFVMAALFGLDRSDLAPQLGLILLVGFVLYVWVRAPQSWLWQRPDRPTQTTRRSVEAGTTLAIAAVAALVAGPLVHLAGARDRTNLREVVDPPFEIRDLRTPLVTFKESLRDDAEDDIALVVTGPALEDRRIRLATLYRYDGVIWTAADTDSNDGLVPVGRRFPGLVEGGDGEAEQFTFELVSQEGHWLPTIGTAQALTWGSAASDVLGSEPQLLFRVDPNGGNLLVEPALGPRFNRTGLTYTVEALELPTAEELTSSATLVPAPLPASRLVTPFEDLANEIVGQSSSPLDKIRAIEAALSRAVSEGALVSSAGAGKNPTYDVESPPGHALHRVSDLLFQDQNEYRGTAEQYAATFAVLVAAVDVPARVVVGYVVDEETVTDAGDGQEEAEVRRSDLTVWIEVPFEGIGWVAFSAGPPETALPEGRPQSGGGTQSAITVPPLPEQDDPEDELEVQDEEEEVEPCTGTACEQSTSRQLPAALRWGGGGLGVILALVAVGAGIIAGLKQRRRRRRRRREPAGSIAGAWHELLDLKTDQGQPVSSSATVREATTELVGDAGNDHIRELSRLVEAAAYGGPEPTISQADLAWSHIKGIERTQGRAESAVATVRRRLSLRSLRSGPPRPETESDEDQDEDESSSDRRSAGRARTLVG